ncbi:hypothetical protein HPB51_002396 [Rhipicephalus microplus]|uniref:Uncharacterized protein n=1 Tax=Rhipicephalus microplus TaxID=6941 RepID=A0A9J6DSM6_RHIMP|nr:hypothetical protein HPB51_002396 [Rhipicephalus microplus]
MTIAFQTRRIRWSLYGIAARPRILATTTASPFTGPQVPRVVNCCLRYLEDHVARGVRQRPRGAPRPGETSAARRGAAAQRVSARLASATSHQRPVPAFSVHPACSREKQATGHPAAAGAAPAHAQQRHPVGPAQVPKHRSRELGRQEVFHGTAPSGKQDGRPQPGHHAGDRTSCASARLPRRTSSSWRTWRGAEERCEVILVVRQLIENYEELFRVSAEDLDSLYKRLLVESPEDLEILLRRRFYSAPGSQDDDGSDQVFDGANAEDDEEEAEEQLRTVLMRPVTTVATHRGRERRSTASSQQQDDPVPYILITPEARGASERRHAPATSKGRRADGDDDDDGNVDVEVSFTLKMPSAPNVPAYLTEATSESSTVARPLRKPTRESSPPSSATTEEEVTITIEAAPAARKSKGSSRRFLSSKEKEEKAFKINKSKSASSILSFFGGSSESRRDSADASSQPRPVPRRDSREVRFQTEKWRRCEIISSEHTDKRHK